jgi:hypothetical protein
MFVLTIADSTPVLNICIWQNCSKHWVLGELWKVVVRICFGCKRMSQSCLVVWVPKFLSPILITFTYLERGVSYDSSISQATSREKLRDSLSYFTFRDAVEFKHEMIFSSLYYLSEFVSSLIIFGKYVLSSLAPPPTLCLSHSINWMLAQSSPSNTNYIQLLGAWCLLG